MKTKIFLTTLFCLILLFSVSCAQSSNDIIKSYNTADEAASVCGIAPVYFVPEGYEATSYNSVYDFVFEAEYKSKINKESSENEMAGIAVLRVVDSEYNVSNLSGFSETEYAGVYEKTNGEKIVITTKNGIYMAQWQETVADKLCNISYTLFGNSVYSSEEALENYTKSLESLVLYFEK
jgi:outer membrane lipoprotein-sorting protein